MWAFVSSEYDMDTAGWGRREIVLDLEAGVAWVAWVAWSQVYWGDWAGVQGVFLFHAQSVV